MVLLSMAVHNNEVNPIDIDSNSVDLWYLKTDSKSS